MVAENEQPAETENDIYLENTVTEVSKNEVKCRDKDGNLHTIACDRVICASGQRPKDTSFATELRAAGIDAYTLGDATDTGDFRTATRSAMDVVMGI